MSNALITLAVAFVIVVFSCFLLGVSKFLTGKSRLRLGMCGRDPTQTKKKGQGCGTTPHCGICGRSAEEEENTDDEPAREGSEQH
ncbi:MAG: hypothetical protein WB791_03585 [Waddliaceae bacterium]